ncbi:excisionase family DNA binding protein [Streptomonospora nanhaiensis]|uniref:Excisionase family DNA binding protein n=1 Tax=Streptomonospora nanhaiensis TaxID=1323731 RepID=A0A853BK84_9ACTN|nr:helix-turn-helix domain-containing protein [Streptomonospora nanhaiensis]NYI95899.1 excisionase family DNA binding protein [Streptomonospora nanhaiensis]
MSPQAASVSDPNELLKVSEVCRELRISRSTWDRMVRLNEAPRMKRMGGKRGEIRVRRRWLDEWLENNAG